MSSTIYAVQPIDGLKHAMTDGDVAASLGEGTIALSELYKHILPKPMTAYSFPPNGTAGEEGVRNRWMTNQLETMMSILSLGIVHKKRKFVDRYPTLTNSSLQPVLAFRSSTTIDYVLHRLYTYLNQREREIKEKDSESE